MTRSSISLPIAATSLAVFLLYTNLPVVLAQGGVLPTAVAAAVPALLAAAVLHGTVIQRRPIVIDRTFVLMCAFLVVLLVGAFAAVGHAVALARIGTFAVEGLAIYFLVRNGIRTRRELSAAVAAMLGAASLLAGLAVFQAATGAYEQEFLGLARRSLEHLEEMPASYAMELGDEDRARGPVDDPNRFAQILLFAAPFAFVLHRNALRRRTSWVAAACFALLVGGVLVTYSRGAFVTMVVLAGLATAMRLVRTGSLLAAVAAGCVLVPIAAPGYSQRILSISGVAGLFGSVQVEADGPTRGRTTEMLAALAAYVDHPVVGVGPGQYLFHSVEYQALPEISIRELPEPRRAHSLYLEIAAETGTLGLVLFGAIPLLLLRDLRVLRLELADRSPELARLAAGFSLAVFAYLGTGVFLHLSFERYYWFLIGLTSAAIGVLHRAASDRERPDTRSNAMSPLVMERIC